MLVWETCDQAKEEFDDSVIGLNIIPYQLQVFAQKPTRLSSEFNDFLLQIGPAQ